MDEPSQFTVGDVSAFSIGKAVCCDGVGPARRYAVVGDFIILPLVAMFRVDPASSVPVKFLPTL